jgi:ethanolamine ammonia-lyase small subunit
MRHRTCGGRVFVDRSVSEPTHVELSCIICGERWESLSTTNAFTSWILRKEAAFLQKSNGKDSR